MKEMEIVDVEYAQRGGGRSGAVVAGERIALGRFVYLSKTNGEQNSWRVRDFLCNVILSSEDTPLKLSDIESLVDDLSEPPPRFNAENDPDKWRDYLFKLSKEKFGGRFDADSQPVLNGPWKPL